MLSLCFTACSNSNNKNIIEKIEVVGDRYIFHGVEIGKSTFSDTEKIYPDIDIKSFKIEENLEIPYFNINYTMKVLDEKIDMQVRYEFACKDVDFLYQNKDDFVPSFGAVWQLSDDVNISIGASNARDESYKIHIIIDGTSLF